MASLKVLINHSATLFDDTSMLNSIGSYELHKVCRCKLCSIV